MIRINKNDGITDRKQNEKEMYVAPSVGYAYKQLYEFLLLVSTTPHCNTMNIITTIHVVVNPK